MTAWNSQEEILRIRNELNDVKVELAKIVEMLDDSPVSRLRKSIYADEMIARMSQPTKGTEQ